MQHLLCMWTQTVKIPGTIARHAMAGTCWEDLQALHVSTVTMTSLTLIHHPQGITYLVAMTHLLIVLPVTAET